MACGFEGKFLYTSANLLTSQNNLDAGMDD